MTRNDDILSKIKACLNLASESANTTEAEMTTALSMAKKLMAQHNLSEAEVLAHDPDAVQQAVEEATVETRSNPHAYESHLAMVIKELFSVEPLLTWQGAAGKRRRCIKFFGLQTDLAIAAAAFKILRDEVNKMAASCGFESGTSRDQWRLGVVIRLQERARDMSTGLSKEDEVKCRDLVVTKGQLIKSHIAEKVGKTTEGRSRARISDAYLAGKEAGDAVNLNFRGQVSGGGDVSALRLK